MVSSAAATQMATTSQCRSLVTLNGVTTAKDVLFTQTFASTALGTWALGAAPGVGSIGMGTIQGTPGATKTKRGFFDALQTPGPLV